MASIFISYSRKDIDIARNLAGDLEKAGFDVWWDISDLRGGDDWVRVIPSAIEASQIFIVLLSPKSIQSQWVKKEYLHALNLRMKIIPVMIETCAARQSAAEEHFERKSATPAAAMRRGAVATTAGSAKTPRAGAHGSVRLSPLTFSATMAEV